VPDEGDEHRRHAERADAQVGRGGVEDRVLPAEQAGQRSAAGQDQGGQRDADGNGQPQSAWAATPPAARRSPRPVRNATLAVVP
jgi:hypothetical protein